MGKNDDEITGMQTSFMLDVLARDGIERVMLDWWKKYIGELVITTSPIWDSLRLKKDKAFYDLITEIVTEQVLNAMSHGNINAPIQLHFGQADEFKGIPRWTFVESENECGEEYPGGRGVGISTLNETLLLLNNNKRGIEANKSDNKFDMKVWILASLLKPR